MIVLLLILLLVAYCDRWPILDRLVELARGAGRHYGTGLAKLSASAEVVELTIEAAGQVTVDAERRTITGVLIPAGGIVGHTSAGPTIFAAGSLSWSDPRRVKLLREHQQSDSLGYASSLEWTADGALIGSFYVPPSPTGDRALVEAANGIRDGFSVGAAGLTASRDGAGNLVVTAGALRENSLVSVPAFDDSRVTRVAASQEGTTRMTVQTVEAAAAAAAPATGVTPEAVAGRTPDELVAQLVDGIRAAFAAGTIVPTPSAGAAGEPGTTGTATPSRGPSLDELGRLMVRASQSAMEGQGYPAELSAALSVPTIRAALTDVVPADNAPAFRPVYLDELWNGQPYRRQFIENATTQRPLTSTKVIGHRWVTKPEVADYAGDKAAVPSGDAVMEEVVVDAARMAGAHDIDRIYRDLGDPQWWVDYFEAMTESYARKSDAKAAALAWAATADASAPTPATLLAGVVGAVIDLATAGESIDYVAMNAGVVAELLNIKDSDKPAFFSGSFSLGTPGEGGLGGLSFFMTPGITTAKGVMVGNKAATRWHELPGLIRVQAENIPNGGIDAGVFGYYATYERNDAGKRKFVVT
jgi:phage head maturation protease